MRLGIDFGTTRIVVALADRGNYPVVSFEAEDGGADWFPPLLATQGMTRRYGFEAWATQWKTDWQCLRSVKRLLGEASLSQLLPVGGHDLTVSRALVEMASALEKALRTRSTLQVKTNEPLEAFLGVPANANTNQRFLTVDAFQRAGFTVLGMLNEPSAASIELGHRRKLALTREPTLVLVYDFGGGTFDASLVEIRGETHTVIGTAGVAALGGDDFDEILSVLALRTAGIAGEALSRSERFTLAEECRRKKEALHPNSRRIPIDLGLVRAGWSEISLPVAEFYEQASPLVDQTIDVVEDLLASHGTTVGGTRRGRSVVSTVYVIGGSSELPIVARRLRDRYGRTVVRSLHAHAATAIGLAIQADGQSKYRLRDRLTRHFGVWREAESGTTAVFDPVFVKDTPLPGVGEPPLVAERHYHPAHNIGHFRFVECSELDDRGCPNGDVTTWEEIRFPFTPDLVGMTDLREVPVERSPIASDQDIVESYACDPIGTVAVTLVNRTQGTSRVFPLARRGSRHTRRAPRRG